MKVSVKHRRSEITSKNSQGAKLRFKVLPAFGEFILQHNLRDFISVQLNLMKKHRFPMLRYARFEGLSEEEIIELSIPSHTEFLTNVVNNTLDDYLKETQERWKNDQLPNIGRDQLVAEDITLSAFIRKMALLHFVPAYTAKTELVLQLVAELERYALEAETRSFNTFLEINQVKIKKMNRELRARTNQLLEAQHLANLGSFEWYFSEKKRSAFSPQFSIIFQLEKINSLYDVVELVDPRDKVKFLKMIEGAHKGRREHECECRFMIGSQEKVIWTRGVVEMKNDTPLLLKGTVMDVTARHRITRKLQKNEELYKQAERLAHLGNWTYDLRSGEISWSDELYRIFNMSPQSKEISLEFFLSMVHPDDQSLLRYQLRKILVDMQIDYRIRIVLPGNITKHLLGKGEILKDQNNKAQKIIGTCQDISREVQMTEELKLREENLALLNQSLEEKNTELQHRNEELTSFNYVASHDLQEPLRKIKTFSDLALSRESERLSDIGKGWLDRISNAAGRMQKLIHDLLAFSRTQLYDDSRAEVDLNEVMEGIKSNYESEITAGELTIECGTLPSVIGIPFQLQQLLSNLVSNSVKYRREGQNTCVRISCSKAEVIGSVQKPDRHYLKITVADNGIGFEQKYARKIFEIFQRLHGQLSYSGTGIGLAICKKIVENHNGFIRAAGMPDEGAVFDVYLPQSIVLPEKKGTPEN